MTTTKHRSSPSGPVALEKLSVSHAMGNAGTATVTNVTMTVTGLTTLDVSLAMPTAAPAAGIGVGASWVSAADELTVSLINPTAAQVAAGTMTFTVIRYRFSI